jgi:hypothetical protein
VTDGELVKAILCTLLGISFIFGEILIYVLLRDGPVMSLVLTGLTVLAIAMLAWAFTSVRRFIGFKAEF